MIKREPFTPLDFSRLISWIDDEEELIQFAGPAFTFPLTAEQLEKHLENKKTKAFNVIETTLNQTIGHCEIYLSENSVKLCRILIGEKIYRDKGFGLEIVNQLLDNCFKQYNPTCVELNVYDWNIGAIKCYEKAGFVVNPDKSKTIEVNNKIWTSINMYIKKA